MSYTSLVGHTNHAQASGEKLFDEIIFLVIQCRAAEMTYSRCVIDRNAVLLVHKRALAQFPNTLGNHVYRALEWNLRPLPRPRRAIFHFRFAPRMHEQLIRRGALRAEIPLADRRFWIAFD